LSYLLSTENLYALRKGSHEGRGGASSNNGSVD
jgi:hypothetical protein